jgi:membrane dipeptidase
MLEQNQALKKNALKIDIEKLQQGEAMAQVFAMYIDKKLHESSYVYCVEMLENFKKELFLNSENVSLCRNYTELKVAKNEGKIGAFLSIEEGDALEGSLDKLEFFKEQGISAITLTWNYENELGYPNFEWKHQHRGLKEKGIEVIEAMNNLGMLIDVSHLSDAGFEDVLKQSKTPFIATHSNARAMTNHPRNLSDEMLKKLADVGGLTGINFFNNFLVNGVLKEKLEIAKIEDMVRHIKHIRNVAGVEVIGLGSDFDGIPNPVEIDDASKMSKLSEELLKQGFSYDEVEKMFWKNGVRIIKEVLI